MPNQPQATPETVGSIGIDPPGGTGTFGANGTVTASRSTPASRWLCDSTTTAGPFAFRVGAGDTLALTPGFRSDLRHTYATLQLAAGTSAKLSAEVLGHKDVDITLNRYSHSLPAMHREAAERLDVILGRGTG